MPKKQKPAAEQGKSEVETPSKTTVNITNNVTNVNLFFQGKSEQQLQQQPLINPLAPKGIDREKERQEAFNCCTIV